LTDGVANISINASEIESQLKEASDIALANLVEEKAFGNASVVTLNGRATTKTLRCAKDNDVDLIVTGSHGRHSLQLLLGSTANGILHGAKCDVLAVRIKE